jgi:hypothetical protein
MSPPSDRKTKPDNPRPSVLGVELGPDPEARRRDPRREESARPEPPRSISPFPQQPAPTVIVEQAPPSRRSIIPRELPGWVGKAAAALFAAVVLPVTLAVTRRIDAGTDEVKARAELLKKQGEKEAAQAATAKAELTEINLMSQRVSALEALRGEVAGLRAAVESTNSNVAELTPTTRPPRRLKVRPE